MKRRKTWLGLGVVYSARKGGGGSVCDHGRSGREAREQPAPAAAAPAPRAGAVSQQNASLCGEEPARGETRGSLRPRGPSSRLRGLQPSCPLLAWARPRTARVRWPERGSRLVEDNASQTFSPDPLCSASRPWPPLCRCVGPLMGRAAAAAGLGEGALGREPQRGRDEPGPAGEGSGRRLCCWRPRCLSAPAKAGDLLPVGSVY